MKASTTEREGRVDRGRPSVRAAFPRLVALAFAVLLAIAVSACVPQGGSTGPTGSTTTTAPSTTSTTVPLSTAIGGLYSVNFAGSTGSVLVSQSGTGAAAFYTVSVVLPFKEEGATCTLAPSTVIATFTGAGPAAFPETYDTFNATTCAHYNVYGNVNAYLNTDGSLDIYAGGGTHLAKISNATTVPTLTATGTYSINLNGSTGSVLVSQSGTGAAAFYTVSVVSPFKEEGATCTLAPSTVIATFTGAGPAAFPETYDTFNATTCAHYNVYGNVNAYLNTDNTLTLYTANGEAHLTKTASGTTVPTPTATGTYSINLNGSTGSVLVSQSGTGAAAFYTVSVVSPFKEEGATCTLAPSTVIATFTGAGPAAFPETYDTFNATTCAHYNVYGNVNAYLNTDNTLTLYTAGGEAHLTKTASGTTVPTPTATGTYSINLNGSTGSVLVSQSGTGAAAFYTVSVVSPFKEEGATCTLAPSTVIATFTGAGPAAFPETYDTFNATTCAHYNVYGNVNAYLNTDNTLTLYTAGGEAHLTKA